MQRITLIFFVLFFFSSTHLIAQTPNQIEVFDVEKGAVLKSIPVNPLFHKKATTILHSIQDLYKKVNPIPKKGMMVKIPLNPIIHVKNKWIDSTVDEVIVFFPEDEEPYIMIYDEENNYYFFSIDNHKAETNQLFKLIEKPIDKKTKKDVQQRLNIPLF